VAVRAAGSQPAMISAHSMISRWWRMATRI
jgi:hypothetical protein